MPTHKTMPETPTKHALLAAIKPERINLTRTLADDTGTDFPTAVRLLGVLENEGAITGRKVGKTYSWTRKQPALPQTECENADLINS